MHLDLKWLAPQYPLQPERKLKVTSLNKAHVSGGQSQIKLYQLSTFVVNFVLELKAIIKCLFVNLFHYRLLTI